jgi:hypothetical protein
MRYSWRRFWYNRDGDRTRVGLWEYLPDPHGEYGHILAPGLFELDALDGVPCAVLLGVPGMGKSVELAEHAAALQSREAPGRTVVVVDLRDYDTAGDLAAAVFRGGTVAEWHNAGAGGLVLLLDSFDEALIEVRVLATRLVSELRALPRDRLRVRVVCRAAAFPAALEEGLRTIWSGDAVRVVELAPLRFTDVRAAAVVELGEDRAGAFMHAVADRGATALAAQPNTLKFLLRSYAAGSDLPPTRAQLYEVGCHALCEETNESRRASGRTGALSAAQRLAVASRVAAATVLAARAAVWTGPDSGAVPPSDVAASALVGWETAEGERFRVSEAAVRETLDTGLFSARGANRVGWAHQTYAEFLAARWVARHDMPLGQVLGLVTHPDDPTAAVIPQLEETVVWLAELRDDVLGHLTATDPGLLVRGDLRAATPHERAAVVRALLAAAEANALAWRPFGYWPPYDRLAHNGLAAQLEPVIADRTRAAGARELALDIAQACRLAEIAPTCAALALDRSEQMDVRIDAARLVARVGTEVERRQLTPLAVEPLAEDADDNLKGNALRAAWPHLTPTQLFTALTPPKRGNYSGAYEGFHRELAEELQTEISRGGPDAKGYVLAGLGWHARVGGLGPGFGSLATTLVTGALGHLPDPDVLLAVATLVRQRFARHQPLVDPEERVAFDHAFAAHPGSRLALVAAVLAGAAEADGGARGAVTQRAVDALVFDRGAGLTTADDFAWAGDTLLALPPDDPTRVAWRELFQDLFDWHNHAHTEWAYAHRADPVVDALFGGLFRPFPLDHPAVPELRREQRHAEHRRRVWAERRARAEREAPTPPAPPCAARVAAALAATEAGDTGGWLTVVHELTQAAGTYGRSVTNDVRQGVLWGELDAGLRARAVIAARTYLAGHEPAAPAPPLGRHPQAWPARWWAGYVALHLLATETPAHLGLLERGTWERWAPPLVTMSLTAADQAERAVYRAMRDAAYQAAPEACTSAVLAAVDRAAADEKILLPLDGMDVDRSSPLGPALLARCQAPGMPPDLLGPLLDVLIEHGVDGAAAFATSVVKDAERDGAGRPRAIASASALLVHAADAGWAAVWPAMRDSPSFGRELALRLAVGHDQPMPKLREQLREADVATLLIWLLRTFPPAEDPRHVGVFSPGGRANVVHWRDALLKVLREWGTPEAIAGLERVANELPDLPWLAQVLLRARAQRRAETWAPLPVTGVFALAERADRRVVESGPQLLEVIAESLARYERELQGDLPAVVELWDGIQSGGYRPKDEGALADSIARHLRRDLADHGVVIAREVVVDRGVAGGTAGRRTDVYVTAVRQGTGPADSPAEIVAVIEVKGSWHPDVMTAMGTQLVGDYLRNGATARAGLYVVGHYTCDAWVDERRKRQSARMGTRDALAVRLAAQAVTLSGSGRTVRAIVLNTALP